MIVKILFGAAALALAIGIVLSLAVRLAPLDPEAWALDPLYRLLARHRYAIFGKVDRCVIDERIAERTI